MGNAKIHRTSKKTYIRLGIIIFVVLLLGWLYYESQRPNYRDLEKAYSQLQIPADWQQIGQSDNKGTWGLFCWQALMDDRSCPVLSRDFRPNQKNNSYETALTIIARNPNAATNCEQTSTTCNVSIKKDGFYENYYLNVEQGSVSSIYLILESFNSTFVET